jgi:hypothetical protein
VVIFDETLAFSPTGSASGTGSLLVPEPGAWMLGLIGLAPSIGAPKRRRTGASGR